MTAGSALGGPLLHRSAGLGVRRLHGDEAVAEFVGPILQVLTERRHRDTELWRAGAEGG
jgi:hypothetical protein